MHPRTPPRLTWIFETEPLYFVTICTQRRARLLANHTVHQAFRIYAHRATDHRIGVGRYVLMPDHIHLFVRVAGSRTLGQWIGGLKRQLSRAAALPPRAWQRGFFDHILRSDESYARKWEYVFRNPERAGLVRNAESWPYAGEIHVIDRA